MNEQTIIKYMTEKHYKENQYTCWDFVMDIYKDLYGIILPEYPVDEIEANFKHKLKTNLKPDIIPLNKAKEGDIIVFSLFANQHAGVMINSESFIHLHRQGVQVTDIEDSGQNYAIYRLLK